MYEDEEGASWLCCPLTRTLSSCLGALQIQRPKSLRPACGAGTWPPPRPHASASRVACAGIYHEHIKFVLGGKTRILLYMYMNADPLDLSGKLKVVGSNCQGKKACLKLNVKSGG
jgi:hypothetical protein